MFHVDKSPELQNPGMPNLFAHVAANRPPIGQKKKRRKYKNEDYRPLNHAHDRFTWAFSFCKMPNLFFHLDKSPELQNPGMPNLWIHVDVTPGVAP